MSLTKLTHTIAAAALPYRLRRGRRGSIMILVVALVVMMALIGTAFIGTTRIDRVATKSAESAAQLDHLTDGLATATAEVVVRDLHDQDGNFRPGVDVGSFQIGQIDGGRNDYDHTDGIDFADQQPLRNDAWLASRVPTILPDLAQDWRPGTQYEAGIPVRAGTRFYRALVGHQATVANAPSGTTLSTTEWLYVDPTLLPAPSPPAVNTDPGVPVWPAISGPILAPKFDDPRGRNVVQPFTTSRLMFPTAVDHGGQSFPALRFYDPALLAWQTAIGADTDGDGVADAALTRVTTASVDNLTYYVGVRMIDNGSAMNVNTARTKQTDYVPDPINTTLLSPFVDNDGLEFVLNRRNGNLGAFRSHVGLQQLLEEDEWPLPAQANGYYGGGLVPDPDFLFPLDASDAMRRYDRYRAGMVIGDEDGPEYFAEVDDQVFSPELNLRTDLAYAWNGAPPGTFAYTSQGAAFEVGLASKPRVEVPLPLTGVEGVHPGISRDEDDDPATVGDVRVFEASRADDQANLAARFVLKGAPAGLAATDPRQEAVDDSRVERHFPWDLRGPTAPFATTADGVYQWYNTLFNFGPPPALVDPNLPAPYQRPDLQLTELAWTDGVNTWNARPVRSLLTTHNAVSQQAPNQADYKRDLTTGEALKAYDPAQVYVFGDRVLGTDGRAYVCVRPNAPVGTAPQPIENTVPVAPVAVDPNSTLPQTPYTPAELAAARSYWAPLPWHETPTKASLNTAPFEELWLAYTGAIEQGQSEYIFTSERAAELDNPAYTPGWFDDPYVGMRFHRVAVAAPTPAYAIGAVVHETTLPHHRTTEGDAIGVPLLPVNGYATVGGTPDYYVTPARHPDRMFRNPIRLVPNIDYTPAAPVPAPDYGPSVAGDEPLVAMDPYAVQKLRGAIAAANTVDLRDPDYSVTARTVHLPVAAATTSTVTAINGAEFDGEPGALDPTNDYYLNYSIRFITGQNQGAGERTVNAYTGGNRRFGVFGGFPFPIAVGDQFRVYRPEVSPVTVFGYEAQPFITEVYVNVSAAANVPFGAGATPSSHYVAIELHNPYDVAIDIEHCRLALVRRLRGVDFTGPPAAGLDDAYPRFIRFAADPADVSLDYADGLISGTTILPLVTGVKATIVPPRGYLTIELYDVDAVGVPALAARPAEIGATPLAGAPGSAVVPPTPARQNFAAMSRVGLMADLLDEQAELVLMAPLVRFVENTPGATTGDWNVRHVDPAFDYPGGDIMFAAPTEAPVPPATVQWYPLDSFDFSGIRAAAQGAVAPFVAQQWHYVRPSITLEELSTDPEFATLTPERRRELARDWRFVYPGRYDAAASLDTPTIGDAQPRQQGTVSFVPPVPPTLLSLGRAAPPPVAGPPPDLMPDGYYENSFPINLAAFDWMTPIRDAVADANAPALVRNPGYPFGRDGDALQAPFIGRYVIQPPAPDSGFDYTTGTPPNETRPGGVDEVYEINSISMDAMFAEDTDPNNDYWKVYDNDTIDPDDVSAAAAAANHYPAAPLRQREQVGRFAPLHEDFLPSVEGFIPNDVPRGVTTIRVADRGGDVDRQYDGYVLQVILPLVLPGNVPADTPRLQYYYVDHFDADRAAGEQEFQISGTTVSPSDPEPVVIPAGSEYRLFKKSYFWAQHVLDFVGVTVPNDDMVPSMDPQDVNRLAITGGGPPSVIPNGTDRRFPARAYGRAQAGSSATVVLADMTLPRRLAVDPTRPPTLVFMTGPAAGQARYVSAYLVNDNGSALDFSDDRLEITVDHSTTGNLGSAPAAGDLFVIYGDPEDGLGVEGLVNINTAPWWVIAQLPLVPWEADGSGVPAGIPDADGNGVDDNYELARAIVKHRTTHGPFKSLMELNNVYDDMDGAAVAPVEDRDAPTGSTDRFGWTDRAGTDPQIAHRRGYRNAWRNLETTPNDLTDEWAYDPDMTWGDRLPMNVGDEVSQGQYDNGRDNVYNDFEEHYLMLTRISNLVTLRSDVFTVYLQIQAWRNGGTPQAELVNQRRIAYVVDRNPVTRDPGSRPVMTPVPTE